MVGYVAGKTAMIVGGTVVSAVAAFKAEKAAMELSIHISERAEKRKAEKAAAKTAEAEAHAEWDEINRNMADSA